MGYRGSGFLDIPLLVHVFLVNRDAQQSEQAATISRINDCHFLLVATVLVGSRDPEGFRRGARPEVVTTNSELRNQVSVVGRAPLRKPAGRGFQLLAATRSVAIKPRLSPASKILSSLAATRSVARQR